MFLFEGRQLRAPVHDKYRLVERKKGDMGIYDISKEAGIVSSGASRWAIFFGGPRLQRPLPLFCEAGMYQQGALSDDTRSGFRVSIMSASLEVLDRHLGLVSDLVLYTMERAELKAKRAGCEGKGVVVYIDCSDCSLGTLRRFASAVIQAS
jgi:hypothetical protein